MVAIIFAVRSLTAKLPFLFPSRCPG
jgi:hypothetical protein